MQQTTTTDKIVAKIQAELAAEGINLSEDNIYNAIQSQFSITAEAMSNGENVKLDKFGKFGIKDGRRKIIDNKKD